MSGYAAKQIELSVSYTTSQVIVTRKPVLRRSAASAEARTRDRSANCSRDSSAARSTYQFSYVGRKPSVSTLRQKSPPRTTTPVPCKLSRMSCASPVENAISWMCRPREIPLFRTSGGTNAIHCYGSCISLPWSRWPRSGHAVVASGRTGPGSRAASWGRQESAGY
jgi:hypothetical protein